jgi:hypothetical protein
MQIVHHNKKLSEELIAYVPLIRHGPHRKRHLQQHFVAVGMSLPNYYLATICGYKPADTRIQLLFYCCVYSLPRKHVYRALA